MQRDVLMESLDNEEERAILRRLYEKNPPFDIYPRWRKLTGTIPAMVMLSFAFHRSVEAASVDGWFSMSQAEWFRRTCVKYAQQARARKKFIQLGFWEEQKIVSGNGSPRILYRVKIEELTAALKARGVEPTGEPE